MSRCKNCGKSIGGFWELCEECEITLLCDMCGRWLMSGECLTCDTCIDNFENNLLDF